MEKSRQSRAQGDSQYQRNSPLYPGISKRVDEKRAILEQKLVEGRGFTFFTGKPDNRPIPFERHIGAESMFKEIWNWVEDETVRCIGLFGVGGVGKTTLLDRLQNQFCHARHDYNFSLRVVVSRRVNLDGIQEAILKELKLPKDQWGHVGRIRRASFIHNFMKEKNFFLFLDDLWEPIDLIKDIGIPCHDHAKKCKIIFTTRVEEVCNRMLPDKIKKVECLLPDKALQLFRQKLGEETWDAHPLIPKIAASLVHECKCLPIALITMAGAMTSTTELKDWMDAENYLKSQLPKFTNMNERVLATLEFSYKNLPDRIHQICFLYLSIFPEDDDIRVDDAIEHWIGEGFLDECGDVHEARNYGEKIFRRLRHASLVEFTSHPYVSGELIKMHDVVREMALWVDSEHGLETDRVLVREGLVSFWLEEVKKWEKAKRMSLWGISCNSLANVSCYNLSTLVIRGTGLRMIPDDFFLSTPCLRVLDLAYNLHLSNIPKSIWKLKDLRYLNLYLILRWPLVLLAEIKYLNKLEVLILSHFFVLPDDALSHLSSLRVLQLPYSSLLWNDLRDPKRDFLEELQMMQSLEEISITLCSLDSAKKLLGYATLHRYLRKICLHLIHDLNSFRISTSLLRRLEHLSSLDIRNCQTRQIEITGEDEISKGSPRRYSNMESLTPKPSSFVSLDNFHSLKDVTIINCENLVEVTSLICHAPILKMLHIESCASLEEVIIGVIENNDVSINRIFTCLACLKLVRLTRLERICKGALPFPSLKEIKVLECYKLKELPLNRNSAKALQLIEGNQEWWEGLDWNDPGSKYVFSTKFVRCLD